MFAQCSLISREFSGFIYWISFLIRRYAYRHVNDTYIFIALFYCIFLFCIYFLQDTTPIRDDLLILLAIYIFCICVYISHSNISVLSRLQSSILMDRLIRRKQLANKKMLICLLFIFFFVPWPLHDIQLHVEFCLEFYRELQII